MTNSSSIPSTPMILQTTGGPVSTDDIGVVLPHEHLVTDLRGPSTSGYGVVDLDDVLRVMTPNLVAAKARGVDVLVECSSVGVGRHVLACARLAQEAGLHVMVPTGIYTRASYTPIEYHAMSEEDLAEWMIEEIRTGIEGSRIQAGFIKLACDDHPLDDFQKRMLRAAAQASLRTGVVIASHTLHGERLIEQADVLEAAGLSLDRFIWIHAQSEPDINLNKQVAARGVYIEYDSISDNIERNQKIIERILAMVAAGFGHRILLSHDAGWYQPGSPDGGSQRSYNALTDQFIPAMYAAGLDDVCVQQVTGENPLRAFAIPDYCRTR